MLHFKKHIDIELYAYLFDLHISLHLEQFDVIYVGYGNYSIIPITRLFYLNVELLKIYFLNVVLMNHLPLLLKSHVSILLMQYVPILEVMVLRGNHDCAFPSNIPCSKSWFFYINDKEMDNVNKGGQRPSSMLSYG
jgi:hypothetical protein